MDKFEKYSNYNKNTNYQSIVFGADSVLLETELQELQQIQENARTSLIRKMVNSGFTELVQHDFQGEPMILNPIENGAENGSALSNTLYLAPFRAIVNGYEINGTGNTVYGAIDNYITVDLGDASSDINQDSLVYLEAWFEYAKGNDMVKKNGYLNGDDIGRYAIDERVGEETSRRIVLKWNICVKNDVNFDDFPEGLGYNSTNSYSHVFAQANGQFGTKANVNAAFCEATNVLFSEETFNEDKNLYIAGRKDYEISSSTFVGNYVYALPMFRIRRRNTQPYSISNYNGAKSQYDCYTQDSVTDGDVGSGFRLDGLFYDKIDVNDIIDIRKSISFSDYNEESLGDETILNIFKNQLSTYQTPKTRRVQFGASHLEHDSIFSGSSEGKATLIVPFDMDYLPYGITEDITSSHGNFVYQDSIFNNGIIVDANKYIKYNIDDRISNTEGTIDFYFKPIWNGSDDVDCEIITLSNISGNPILKLEKKQSNLVLSQYNMPQSAKKSTGYVCNEAIVSLASHLLVANRYYHFRISWTESPMPINGQIYLYINGNLMAQANCTQNQMTAKFLTIGSIDNTITNKGFLMEELIGYSTNFEILSLKGSSYGYAKNNYWPMLPKDLKANADSVLLMPGFNGVINNYSDVAYTQEQTVFQLSHDTSDTTHNTFYIELSSDRIVKSVDAVYNLIDIRKNNEQDKDSSGKVIGVSDTNKRLELTRKVLGEGTNAVTIQVDNQNATEILVVATLELADGCGGADIPIEIHKACIMKYDEEADNFDYNLNFSEEVSFNDINSEYAREVIPINSVTVNNETDMLYDISNAYRDKNQCFARLIKYHISMKAKSTSSDGVNVGGTNVLTVPIYVYGYKVCGVISSSLSTIESVTCVPSDTVGEEDLYYKVTLKDILLAGESVELELATEGYSFDYDLNSKTIMTDMHKCFTREFVADGVNSVYTLSCLDSNNIITGGILKSVFSTKTFAKDSDGNNDKSSYTYTTQCFQDGEIFYDEDGNPTDEKVWTMMEVTIKTVSYGTPMITIDFGNNKPRKGVNIRLPIVTTYQMQSDEILSIWYSYYPYQGLMNTTPMTLTRISNWKYFATTLGTGKTLDETIKCNVINNLPGGQVYGYKIDNKDIILKNVKNNMDIVLASEDLNKKVVFFNDFMLKNDDTFANLHNEFIMDKNCIASQDGLITISNGNMELYFDDCEDAIAKYIGAYCTVITDTGEIMVLVVGNMDDNATVINKLNPKYGDVYRISGRPTTKRA